jgi:glycosyltransferase involved in cell wall biosynthesis
VLLIDDRVPHRRFGSGFPRGRALVGALSQAGCRVAIHPTAFPESGRVRGDDGPPIDVELIEGGEGEALFRTLADRLPLLDRILVSRPANLVRLRAALERLHRWPSPVPILYDAEAIDALREERRCALEGRAAPRGALEAETALAREAHTVLAVSEVERELFVKAGAKRVLVLGHALSPSPTPRRFAERSGLLFVGAFYEPGSPNSDGLLWFAETVWPRVRERLPAAKLTVAGPRPGRRVRALDGDGIEVLATVADLTPLYDRARLFVAPIRFAAGLPHKIHEAAAHGLPVVTTPLNAELLGWHQELSVAERPEAFAEAVVQLHEDPACWHRLRDAALARVTADCAPDAFAARVAEALELD